MLDRDHARFIPPNALPARPQLSGPNRSTGIRGLWRVAPKHLRICSRQGILFEKHLSMKNEQRAGDYTSQVVDSAYGHNRLPHAHWVSGQSLFFYLMEFSKFIRYGK
jgi:hypothetical protein